MLLKNKIINFLIIIFFYIFFLSFIWEYIKLPLNNEENVIGALTLKNINPLNDTLRFILFVFPPLLFFFLFLNFNYSHRFIKVSSLFDKIKSSTEKKEYMQIKDVFHLKILFFLFIILEFCSLDFSKYSLLDTLHDGDYLTPLINYKNFNGFWSSSFTIHGGRDLFIPVIANKLFGSQNFASIKFVYIFLVFIIKFFSIILSYQISQISNLNKNLKIVIFAFSCPFLLSLSSYEQNDYFNIRDLFVIIFFITFIQIFIKKNNWILIYLLSLIPTVALFFHYDTGIYLNIILLSYFVYLGICKNYQDLLKIFFFLTLNYIFFYFYFGETEIINFLKQITHIINNIDKIHGLEYPRPFFSIGEVSDSARGTKLLVFFVLVGFAINLLVFSKNEFINSKEKFLIIFIFIYSLMSFKNALGRSDGGHMMLSSDWITILLFYLISFAFFHFLSSKIIKKNKLKYISEIISIFFIIFLIIEFHNKDFYNVKNNIKSYIQTPNSKFITKDRKIIIKKISKIIENDNCVQNFTVDLSLPYLLNKPTCSKFFSSWIVSGKETETEYIKFLKQKKASHIIYNSPFFTVDDIPTNKRLLLVDAFIKENYYEVFNQQNYVIFKRKKQ